MSNLKIKWTAAIIVMRKDKKSSGNASDSHSQGNISALHVFKTVWAKYIIETLYGSTIYFVLSLELLPK